MEHPLQVEEFSPADALRVALAVRAVAPLSLPDAAPLPPLPDIPASEVLFLRPSDPQYRNFLPAANSRAQLSPALRAVCRNERAVAAMIDWVVSNNFTFAVRCGGHSYEGFSQSSDVVIDLRGMADIAVEGRRPGHGRRRGIAVPHLSGAGGPGPDAAGRKLSDRRHRRPYHGRRARTAGEVARPDLRQVPVIDSQSRILAASATSEPDPYWACKGGGGGSFGVAIEFRLSVFPLATGLVFGVSWKLSQSHAAKIFAAWQH
jgi:hypothetical protein